MHEQEARTTTHNLLDWWRQPVTAASHSSVRDSCQPWFSFRTTYHRRISAPPAAQEADTESLLDVRMIGAGGLSAVVDNR